MSEPIKFYKGEETGIVHESYSDINTSLFKDQYIKALNEIGAFIKLADEWKQRHSDEDEFDINNVFAFIGERGTGKTSCMKSVADMIKELSDDWHNQGQIVRTLIKSSKRSVIEQKTFHILDPIDPTTLDVKTNILEVVIGKLFEDFQRNRKTLGKPCDNGEDDNKRSKVLDSFQKIKKCLKYLISRDLFEQGQDSLIQLSDLALVTKLKPLFKELLDSYLKYLGKEVLVLQIDDVDLQAQYAYTMMEQIRKYFIQEQVIVLLAAKEEQLSLVLELEYTRHYERLIGNNRISPEEITDMASRYLLKLLPINHRVYMPTFEIYADTPIEYYESRQLYNQYKSNSNSCKNPFIDRWSSVKYSITTLIFIKCRYLFYHAKGVVSPIVPRNLRELRHLFAMLAEMEPYYINGSEMCKDHLNNKAQFLNYLYGTWVSINIAPNDFKIVNSILSIKDASSVNKVVLSQLHKKFGNALISEFAEIINDKNSSYNVSIADVYTVLDYIKLRTNSVDAKMLIFFIETFYSIKLYEYYDRVTDVIKQKGETILDSPKGQEDYDLEKKYFDKNDISDESIRKIEVVDDVSDYELFVGGSLINTDAYPLLPKERGIKQANDRARLNFDELKKVAENIIHSSVNPVDTKKLQLIEFFALCISRLSSNEITGANYRLMNDLYYKFDSERDFKFVEFNLGSFFTNVLNVKRAYYRVHPKLYEYACTHKESLYYQLLKYCSDDRGKWAKNSKHALLSCASIRNYEILSDFINQTSFSRLLRSKGSVVANLLEFFKRVADYKIKNYDRGGENNVPNIIAFNYAEIVVKALSLSKNDEQQFFDSIFIKNIEPISKPTIEFDEFDIEGIMDNFKDVDYSIRNVKLKIKKLCNPIFELNQFLLKILDEELKKWSSYRDDKRINREDIINILNVLKSEQKYYVTK